MVVAEDFVCTLSSGSKVPTKVSAPTTEAPVVSEMLLSHIPQDRIKWTEGTVKTLSLLRITDYLVTVFMFCYVFLFLCGWLYDEGIGSRDLEKCAGWDITQHRVVIPYRRFGTTYPHHIQVSPMGYPETSARNYHPTPRNIPEERSAHLHRGRSMKSRFCSYCAVNKT